MNEYLDRHDHYDLLRDGRFLIAELHTPHQVLSTSAHRGGLCMGIRFLVNHQSCEGTGHEARFALIRQLGQAGYHRHVCKERSLPPDDVAVMGTAANMNCAAHVVETHAELRVCAVVTAGVEGNAGCAGDPATWHEEDAEWIQANPQAGTINTMLLINWPLTPGAMARAAVTMTEGKSAALRDLAVSSRYSHDLATGTGTDQYCIAAPLDETRIPKTNAGHHAKLGELIGRAVRSATLEALRWQNGLEPSHTRSVFHALKRFGLGRKGFLAAMHKRLKEEERVLLEKNLESVVYEPRVSAAAYALAAVWDRVRFGTLSHALADPVLRQQAATLAASLAAKPDAWPSCYARLHARENALLELVYDAFALGWRLKWT
ncbi:MAG: adenosylcobinamide amidohydrolase [Gemmatimonadota bacterium]|nr:adenosylcobinamide amidohydrolase [Gemmatimonadota bacterium]